MPKAAFTVFGPVRGYFLPGDESRTLAYAAGHRGSVDLPDGPVDELACCAVLRTLFEDGNGMGDGEGFTVGGRSMSVGDVVTIAGCGTWRCDGHGWTELAGTEARRFPVEGADHCAVVDAPAARTLPRIWTGPRRFRTLP